MFDFCYPILTEGIVNLLCQVMDHIISRDFKGEYKCFDEYVNDDDQSFYLGHFQHVNLDEQYTILLHLL